jgi:pimeloyl-ACP methyl ester carboxylesterase
MLAADADTALAAIGPACVAGVGIGAYVALLLAGGRPDQVAGALLAAGPGLAGAGAIPDFDGPFAATPDPQPHTEPAGRPDQPRTDPDVRLLDLDFRPDDYVETFARAAKQIVLLEDGSRPAWWETTRRTGAVRAVKGNFATGLAELARCIAV